MSSPTPKISVIIPFFGKNLQDLERCLIALSEQVGITETVEVVVVDNNSPRLLDEWQSYPSVVITHEEKPGSYAARNRGVQCSSGHILAFTDADCIPDPKWLLEGVAAMAAGPSLRAIAGDIRVKAQNKDRPSLFEHLDAAIHHRQEDYVTRLGFGATANLFVTKQTFTDIGAFDVYLLSGGDQEWCSRLTKRGGEVHFCREAIVMHPARKTLFELVIKNARGVGGQFSRFHLAQKRLLPLLRIQSSQFMNRRAFLLKYTRHQNIGFWKTMALLALLMGIYCVKSMEVIKLCAGGKPIRR